MIFLTLLRKYWQQIIIVALVAAAIFSIYNYGYSRGYQNRVYHYEEIAKKDFLNLNKKIDGVETLASTLSIQVQKGQNITINDLNKITSDLKSKKFSILKNGECVPSEDFINTFNAVIDRGNLK